MAMIVDTLVNLLSGLGTSKDKGAFNQYVFSPMAQEELRAAYRTDWIARKVVSIPAQDATRAWRLWQADVKQITAIENVEKRFDVRSKTRKALTYARLFGGGALVMGVDDGDQAQPLNLQRLRPGSLRFLHAVSRHELLSGEINLDVMSPDYGLPSYYEAHSPSRPSVRIHPSRVLRFIGCETPDNREASQMEGWGDPVLQIVRDAVLSCSAVTSSIASLVHESKIDIVKLPELSERLVDEEYSRQLTARFTLANTLKSMTNTLLMDSNEEWDRKEINFSALPDVVRVYLLIASGAADIPATRMLGQSPAGMTSTGESDIRNYYDSVSSQQENEIRPVLASLDQVILAEALGVSNANEQIFYEWQPLWQMTAEQKAEIAVKKSTVFTADVNSGMIPEIALANARINQLIEDGVYPGLEREIEEADAAGEGVEAMIEEKQAAAEAARAALAQAGKAKSQQEQEEIEADAEDAPPIMKSKDGRPITADATPRSLYVSRSVVNASDLVAWIKSEKMDDILPAQELHVTIVHSAVPMDWTKIEGDAWGQDEQGRVTIPPGGMRMIDLLDGDAVALIINSSVLQWRHADIKRAGAFCEHDEYMPHITLGYPEMTEVVRERVRNMTPYQGRIVLGPEIFEESRQ